MLVDEEMVMLEVLAVLVVVGGDVRGATRVLKGVGRCEEARRVRRDARGATHQLPGGLSDCRDEQCT